MRTPAMGLALSLLLLLPSVGRSGGARHVRAWKAPAEFLEGSFIPITADDRWVFHDHNQQLVQRSLRTGKRRRVFSSLDECSGPLIDLRVDEKRVYVLREILPGEESMAPGNFPPVFESCLVVFDRVSGKVLWSKEDGIPAPIALATDGVVISTNGGLFKLNPADGKSIWRIDQVGAERVAVHADQVFTVDGSGAVEARDLASGKLRWKKALGGQRGPPPTAGGAFLFVVRWTATETEESSRLFCLEQATGKILWKKAYPEQILDTRPVYAGGRVYQVSSGWEDRPGHLLALDADSGKLAWKQAISTDANGHDFTPVMAGAMVLVWSGDLGELEKHAVSLHYALLAFDARTGRPIWKHRPRTPEKYIFSRPIVRTNRLLFADGWRIRALRPVPSRRPPAPNGD